MDIQPVKGTRDFYPPQMAVHNCIIDGWKKASIRHGFVEYDGPIFEYLRIYEIKSGQEISEQLFSLTDRGERALAIRPEMTPTLARMVNQQISSLPKPVKWFSVPRLCRAEKPQKGRLREFFQWNIDIVGIDDVLADAEIIFCSLDYLRQTGLTSKDVVARISSRRMLSALLESAGLEQQQLETVFAVLDKRNRLPAETFEKMLEEKVPDPSVRSRLLGIMSANSIEGAVGAVKSSGKLCDQTAEAVDELKRLFATLDMMGLADWCLFDIGIVRGLAYYTGMVYEIHDRGSEFRAIGGGGRYDNLLAALGGPATPATGFAMGDCVLEILLRRKGLLNEDIAAKQLGGVDYYVAFTDTQFREKAVALAADLRRTGCSAVFSYKGANLAKQLKEASAANAAACIIIGQEYSDGIIGLKDMNTARQENIRLTDFWPSLKH